MNKRNAYMSVVLALTVCGLGLTACDPEKTKEKDVVPDKEFVCYDDGALVERHIGVTSAGPVDAAGWRIKYKDGHVAWYQQPPGETCQVEEVTTTP